MKFVHIINPVNVGEQSDLYIAQPITFESIRRALRFSEGNSNYSVEIVSVCYEEDLAICPIDIAKCEVIDRSLRDIGLAGDVKKLPFLGDLLSKAKNYNCDYVIYTNVDIAVQPFFYDYIYQLISDGYDSFVINRRTISTRFTAKEQLPMMYAERGRDHPGFDCFIFPLHQLENMILENICIGMPGVGLALVANLMCNSKRFWTFEWVQATFHIGDDRVWNNSKSKESKAYNLAQCDLIVKKAFANKEDLDFSPIPIWAGFNIVKILGVKSIRAKTLFPLLKKFFVN